MGIFSRPCRHKPKPMSSARSLSLSRGSNISPGLHQERRENNSKRKPGPPAAPICPQSHVSVWAGDRPTPQTDSPARAVSAPPKSKSRSGLILQGTNPDAIAQRVRADAGTQLDVKRSIGAKEKRREEHRRLVPSIRSGTARLRRKVRLSCGPTPRCPSNIAQMANILWSTY
jgi:hypothetical protein